MTTADLTDDDREQLKGIMDASAAKDSARLTDAIYRYYRDPVRADRTPRELLYLHMGLLIGALLRVTRPIE